MPWAECAYCDYHVRDPYLYDNIGLGCCGALCDWCEAHLDAGGEPMDELHWWCSRPSSMDFVSRGLVARKLIPTVIRHPALALQIARFLIRAGKEKDIDKRISLFGGYT
jgi:hypothetical protein